MTYTRDAAPRPSCGPTTTWPRCATRREQARSTPTWSSKAIATCETGSSQWTKSWLVCAGSTTRDFWLSTKSRYAFATYSSPDYDYETSESCNAPIAIRPKRDEVVVTVPWRCVPEGPLKIKVTSMTGHHRTDEPTMSRDNAYFTGTPVVLPN